MHTLIFHGEKDLFAFVFAFAFVMFSYFILREKFLLCSVGVDAAMLSFASNANNSFANRKESKRLYVSEIALM